MSGIPTEAPKTKSDKLKVLEATRKQVDNDFGEGSMVRLGSKQIVPMACIPSGILSLDHSVIGAGGFPRGRITEVFGPESSSKTSLALTLIAEAQKSGGVAAYIDAEHSLDPVYARALGVDVDDMFISQPDYGEQALSIAEKIIETNACDIVVIDSVAALVPKAELDGEMEDQNMGLHARLMSKAMRKLAGITRKAGTVLLMINQVREKIGVMYGNPETTTGGRALKFYASLRLRTSSVGQGVKEGSEQVASQIKIKAVKNKCGVPFRETTVNIYYGKGFDKIGSLVELVNDRGILQKSGSWFCLGPHGEKIANGKDNLIELLSNDDELRNRIEAIVKEVIKQGVGTQQSV